MQVPVKPLPKVTVGVAGMVNPAGNVALIVLVAARWPVADGVKTKLQVDVA